MRELMQFSNPRPTPQLTGGLAQSASEPVAIRSAVLFNFKLGGLRSALSDHMPRVLLPQLLGMSLGTCERELCVYSRGKEAVRRE